MAFDFEPEDDESDELESELPDPEAEPELELPLSPEADPALDPEPAVVPLVPLTELSLLDADPSASSFFTT